MNKVNLNRIMALSLLLIGLTFSMSSQKSEELTSESKLGKISLEIDPSTFAFNGYGFHLRYQPKSSDHLLIGAGIYAMDFPALFVNMNPENKDEGWKVRLKGGVGLFAEHYFTEVHNKWYVGAQFAIQKYEIKKDFYDGSAEHTNSLLIGYAGYAIMPFDFDMYFKLWGGLGYAAELSGETTIGDAEFDVSPILMFGALHVGYTFK